MSEEVAEGKSVAKASVEIGMFWPIVFFCMFVTGNCSTCGGDRDYVGEYVDRCGD